MDEVTEGHRSIATRWVPPCCTAVFPRMVMIVSRWRASEGEFLHLPLVLPAKFSTKHLTRASNCSAVLIKSGRKLMALHQLVSGSDDRVAL